MGIEDRFDVAFMAKLTSEEKQIQQNYRPVIGVHKWFARRPGSMFRGLLLSEFGGGRRLAEDYLASHDLPHVTIADPFMGGGTTLFEAIRLGCNVHFDDENKANP
jgi:putative DNA methylase